MRLSIPLILASRSPRRKQLLAVFGIPFDVVSAEVQEEELPGESPGAMVRRLASLKAKAVSESYPNSLILGADTTVLIDGQTLGKPVTAAAAASMLRQLSGSTHRVLTAIALVHLESSRFSTAVETTEVEFDHLSEREIGSYIDTGSPFDKAGAYGIQDDRGALFIKGINGDYYTVMGLPLHRLYRLLITDFSDLFSE